MKDQKPLDVSRWSTPRPGRFTPGKETRYPLYRRLGGPQGLFGRVRKIAPNRMQQYENTRKLNLTNYSIMRLIKLCCALYCMPATITAAVNIRYIPISKMDE
jgi:hypothetical protein